MTAPSSSLARLVVALVAVVLIGCAAPGPARAPLPSGAMAVPTDDNLVSSAQSGILCTLSASIPPVTGTLEGDPRDTAWPVWLRGPDGGRIYLLWPRGFSVRFDPAATVLDETGAVFLLAGSPLTLWQESHATADGTKDHPYLVGGLVGTGLGDVQHCYTKTP